MSGGGSIRGPNAGPEDLSEPHAVKVIHPMRIAASAGRKRMSLDREATDSIIHVSNGTEGSP